MEANSVKGVAVNRLLKKTEQLNQALLDCLAIDMGTKAPERVHEELLHSLNRVYFQMWALKCSIEDIVIEDRWGKDFKSLSTNG